MSTDEQIVSTLRSVGKMTLQHAPTEAADRIEALLIEVGNQRRTLAVAQMFLREGDDARALDIIERDTGLGPRDARAMRDLFNEFTPRQERGNSEVDRG
jgi:hypothetical protein